MRASELSIVLWACGKKKTHVFVTLDDIYGVHCEINTSLSDITAGPKQGPVVQSIISLTKMLVNPNALIMAKTLWSFGQSECNRVKSCSMLQ